MPDTDDTVVDRCWREFSDVAQLLQTSGEITLYNTMTEILRQTLLLTAASHFEKKMQIALDSFIKEATDGNELISNLVHKKAVVRQYHTWFAWQSRNANAFFSLFGDNFKNYMMHRIRAGNPPEESIAAFLEIGSARNNLVHQGFGEVPMEKTMDEVYGLYTTAKIFVDIFPAAFSEFSEERCT